jgi:hypothetical protein
MPPEARALRTSSAWLSSVKIALFTACILLVSFLAEVPAKILVPLIKSPSSIIASQLLLCATPIARWLLPVPLGPTNATTSINIPPALFLF